MSAVTDPASGRLEVDDRELRLPAGLDPDATYDVLVNQRHAWSLQPGRDATPGDRPSGRLTSAGGGGYVARWPKAMRPYLVGRARVEVRDHVSGEVLTGTEHVFAGDASKEVMITDGAGRALVLDKWGRMTRPMSSEDSALIDELMDQVVCLLDVLATQAGVPAFICYGTLLGAVRNGQLIGHDNDIDLAYVSRHPYPVDVVRESYRVERTLRAEGWVVRRGSGVRLNVRLKMADGSMRFVDVFTAHWVEGILYIPSDTGFPLPESTILPLSSVDLLGRTVPAPARPEELLAATYGESWRVPDPSFRYDTPPWLSRRLGGWFGGLMTRRKYWDSFASKQSDRVPDEPSPFAQWVTSRYPSTRPVVDLGTGTGRDAVWFARQGRPVTAIDYSFNALNRARSAARASHLPVSCEVLNLYDTRAVLVRGALLSREDEPPDLYARFLLHGLDHHGRVNVLRLASMSLRRGGRLFLEFRTPRDRRRRHVFGHHVRRYLQPATVIAQIEAAGGHVLEQVEGTGLAPFGKENPYVCRIVAAWAGDTDSATTTDAGTDTGTDSGARDVVGAG